MMDDSTLPMPIDTGRGSVSTLDKPALREGDSQIWHKGGTRARRGHGPIRADIDGRVSQSRDALSLARGRGDDPAHAKTLLDKARECEALVAGAGIAGIYSWISSM